MREPQAKAKFLFLAISHPWSQQSQRFVHSSHSLAGPSEFVQDAPLSQGCGSTWIRISGTQRDGGWSREGDLMQVYASIILDSDTADPSTTPCNRHLLPSGLTLSKFEVNLEGDLYESFCGESDQHLYTRFFWTMYYQYLLLHARGE